MEGWEDDELKSKGAAVGGSMESTLGKTEGRPVWPEQGGSGMRSV